MVALILSLTLLTGLANALTFTAPTTDTTLDPTQDMLVSWTSTADDPSTFNLYVGQVMGGSTTSNVQVQTGVSTSSGSFQVPAGTILSYGSNFVFTAQDSTGKTLATSDPFTAAIGQNQVTTANGMTILATSLTAAGTATTAAAGSATSAPGSATGFSASGSGLSTTGFSTSTTSRASSSTSSTSGSGTRTSSASATAATTSANAQPRLMSSGQLVMGAAGVLAGVVALVA